MRKSTVQAREHPGFNPAAAESTEYYYKAARRLHDQYLADFALPGAINVVRLVNRVPFRPVQN
jgi:hypothetical protein